MTRDEVAQGREGHTRSKSEHAKHQMRSDGTRDEREEKSNGRDKGRQKGRAKGSESEKDT